MKRCSSPLWLSAVLIGLGLSGLTGCQVSVGGQTLPSSYYLHDDVQYFAPGSEFKLSKEAAAMKEYNADLQAQGQAPANQNQP